MDLKRSLRQAGYRNDVLTIEGNNFPPPPWKESIATMISYTWMGGLGLQFFGDALFDSLGMIERPGRYARLVYLDNDDNDTNTNFRNLPYLDHYSLLLLLLRSFLLVLERKSHRSTW